MIGKISSFLTAVSSLLFEKMSPKSGFLIEHRQFPPVRKENSLRTQTYFHSSLLSTRKMTTGVEKGTGAEMRPAIVSGIVTGDVSVSYWPIFFSPSLATVPEVFVKVNSAQSRSRC